MQGETGGRSVDLAVHVFLRGGIEPMGRVMGHQKTCVSLLDPVKAVTAASSVELSHVQGKLPFDVVAQMQEGAVEPDNPELHFVLFDRGRKISRQHALRVAIRLRYFS